MTPAFQPGDRIECVDASGSAKVLTVGTKYTVAETRDDSDTIILVEVPRIGFLPARFKKIRRLP